MESELDVKLNLLNVASAFNTLSLSCDLPRCIKVRNYYIMLKNSTCYQVNNLLNTVFNCVHSIRYYLVNTVVVRELHECIRTFASC